MLYYKATAGCGVAKKKNDHAPLTRAPIRLKERGGTLPGIRINRPEPDCLHFALLSDPPSSNRKYRHTLAAARSSLSFQRRA